MTAPQILRIACNDSWTVPYGFLQTPENDLVQCPFKVDSEAPLMFGIWTQWCTTVMQLHNLIFRSLPWPPLRKKKKKAVTGYYGKKGRAAHI